MNVKTQAECIANVKDYKREVESIISSKGNVLILWALSIPDLSKLRTEAEIEPNEILDFDQIVHDGWLPVRKEAKARFYTKLPSYQISLRKKKPFKHHKEVLRTETALFEQCLQFEVQVYSSTVQTLNCWRVRESGCCKVYFTFFISATHPDDGESW